MVVRTSPTLGAAFAAALLITLAELGVLLAVLAPSSRPVMRRSALAPPAERVTFIAPRTPAPTLVAGPGRSSPTSAEAAVPSAPGSSRAYADSLGRASRTNTLARPALKPMNGAPGMPSTLRGGVDASAGVTRGPLLAPRGFSPSAPLTRRVIDSVLDSLNANMPALIWARLPTQAERDAAFKESAQAMRLAGRTLLVPADPHLASGFSLPSVFPRRKQRRAARERTDSIRHADSSAAATPRRPPDARTPA